MTEHSVPQGRRLYLCRVKCEGERPNKKIGKPPTFIVAYKNVLLEAVDAEEAMDAASQYVDDYMPIVDTRWQSFTTLSASPQTLPQFWEA